MPTNLSQSRTYRKFVKGRDEALEILLDNHLAVTNNILKDLFVKWIYVAMSIVEATRMKNANVNIIQAMQRFDNQLATTTNFASGEIAKLQVAFRKRIYLLTLATEAEAIGRALDKDTRYNVKDEDLRAILDAPAASSGSLHDRFFLQLDKVKDNVRRMTMWLAMNKDVGRDEALIMLVNKLPKTKPVDSRRRAIKPLQILEAKKPEPDLEDFSSGFIDEETWNEITDQMVADIPVDRGPEAVFTIKGKDGKEVNRYAWEMEQEQVQDFVYQVRLGQVDAAKQNGLTDFVWIAIVDDRTDDCCLWRDGLTTKEIEALLKGKRADDECQAIVPPAHFNCRCQLAPATDDLPATPESNQVEFEQWLMNS